MESTRNRGRGNLFSCFRPVDDDDVDEPIFYSTSLQSSSDEGGARRRRKLGRSVSAAIKAVIVKTTLLRKSRSENQHVKKREHDGLRSHIMSRGRNFVKSLKKNMSGKPFLEPDDLFWAKNITSSPIFSPNSNNRTPSLASSSSGSSTSSPTRLEVDTSVQPSPFLDQFRQVIPTTKKQKATKKEGGKKCAYHIVPTLEICVLLVCLFALIWGKVFAIVACTSAWLFLTPDCQSKKLRRVGSYEVFDTEEYKKRVIMGGFLERDRCRFPQY